MYFAKITQNPVTEFLTEFLIGLVVSSLFFFFTFEVFLLWIIAISLSTKVTYFSVLVYFTSDGDFSSTWNRKLYRPSKLKLFPQFINPNFLWYFSGIDSVSPKILSIDYLETRQFPFSSYDQIPISRETSSKIAIKW